MNKVEKFIKEQNAIILEDREKTLVELGLTDKEYSPDGKENYQYSEYDYVNGEKKYYRICAVAVTDEEYELILSKANQVKAIKEKEEFERQKERGRAAHRTIKKWIPVFEPKEEWSSYVKKENDNGKSKMASLLRIAAWAIGIIAVIAGLMTSFETEDILPVIITLGVGAMGMLVLYALASALDYLAELTSIARNGYKYKETTK